MPAPSSGLLLVGLYLAWLASLAIFRPALMPPHVADESADQAGLASRVLRALLPPLFLILAVLGSIIAGVFFIPYLYYVVQRLSEALGRKKGEAGQPAPSPAGPTA